MGGFGVCVDVLTNVDDGGDSDNQLNSTVTINISIVRKCDSASTKVSHTTLTR